MVHTSDALLIILCELYDCNVTSEQGKEGSGMKMENIDIRILVSDSGLTYKDIAKEIGIHRGSLSRLMSRQLSPENRIRIVTAIDRIKTREAMRK